MLNLFSQTDVGLVRRNNEDYHFTDPGNGLIIVADGAGGHDHGEIASRIAVESCYQYLTREDYLQDTSNVTRTLMESITFANQQVIEYKKRHMPGSNMGTTLSCVHIAGSEINFAWMGDSRIYLIAGDGGSIAQLSVDHTLIQEMAGRGNVGQQYRKGMLSRMLGNNPYTQPDGDRVVAHAGDKVLVCTDGFSDLVSEDQLLEAIQEFGGDPGGCVATLVEMALDQGGRDNITVALGVVGQTT